MECNLEEETLVNTVFWRMLIPVACSNDRFWCSVKVSKHREKQKMFNENLKTIRKEKGFSQEQLATRLNVVRQTVSKWEKGLSVPDAEMLIDLAEVLNVEVSDLLGKKIEVKDSEEQVDAVAAELAKLNELLVVYGEKLSSTKKKIKNGIAVIIFVIIFFAIYESWNELFYEFGKNLYYMLNK